MKPINLNVMEIDLNILVTRYGALVSTVAHRMIQDREIVREAAQEVWYELCRSLPTFKGDSLLTLILNTLLS